MKPLFSVLVVFLGSLVSGCVFTSISEHADSSWPVPKPARELRQFEGIYQNDGRIARRHPDDNPTKLFDFLDGSYSTNRKESNTVELRFAADGNSLQVRLLSANNHPISSLEVVRGKGYVFSRSALILHSPHWEKGGGNLGPDWKNESDVLKLAKEGGLRGYSSETHVGFLFGVIPILNAEHSAMYWPKVAP